MTNPVFVALDTTDTRKAAALVRTVSANVGGIKIGLEFFLAHGHDGYKLLAKTGLPIFLDLKLHDIPNTVRGALRSILPLKPALVTVHASGGPDMIMAARETAEEFSTPNHRTKIIAVSVLTSMDDKDLSAIGVKSTTENQVVRLAEMSWNAGADGLVCSPWEIETVRRHLGKNAAGDTALLIVPGIRPTGSALGDQKRVMTPKEAKAKGADILVIGRPITAAEDPGEAAWSISIDL